MTEKQGADTAEGATPLDEYVRETLLAIVRGVLDAQADERCGEFIGRVPAGSAPHLNLAHDGQGNSVSIVAFDLATTHAAKRGGGIAVLPFPGFGATAKAEAAASFINRISFSVPTAVPKPDAQRAAEARRRQAEDSRIHGGKSWMGG